MHPARLSFLKIQHAPQKRIVERCETPSETRFVLECGHTSGCVSHFDCSKTATWSCMPCAEPIVRNRYADEFNVAPGEWDA